MQSRPEHVVSPPEPRARLRRLGWLLGCFAAGGVIGVVGSTLTGSDLWYLAIPVAVAGVWMFVANPTECEPKRGDRGHDRPGKQPGASRAPEILSASSQHPIETTRAEQLPMDLLQALLTQPRAFAGRGVNHEGETFDGALAIQPLVGGAALMLNYTATLPDGHVVHAEATLLGRNAEGKLCLWPVMQELPVVIAHVEIPAPSSGAHLAAATFSSGPREAIDAFREEITISVAHDGKLTYAHSWALPHGSFEARSTCEMTPAGH